MEHNEETPKTNYREIATAGRKDDITTGFLANSVIMQNPDQVLREKGRGDFKIYEELMQDDQVKSVFQQRRLALVSKCWDVTPASESAEDEAAAEFIREQVKKIKFDDKTDKMLYGLFYGYSVAEIIWMQEGTQVVIKEIKVRKAKRFKFGTDSKLRLLTKKKPLDGIRMPKNKFWTFSTGADNDDNPYGEGLAKTLYWPVFFKRNDIKFWLVFLEKFGMPTAKAEYARGSTIEERDDILEALDAIQTDSAIAVPAGTIIELIEASRGGTADYAEMHKVMNAAISKIILSQTMTTDDGSSLSQASVHSDVKNEIVTADADLICDSFNEHVVRPLMMWNFPNAGMPKVRRKTDSATDTKEMAERDNVINGMGYEPTQEYIDQTYGEGFKKKAEQTIPTMGAEFAEGGVLGQMLNHRRDQDTIRQGALELSKQYDELIGGRVEELLAIANESQDLEAFSEAIDAMFEETPPEKTVETVQRATMTSRLMGLFRGQR